MFIQLRLPLFLLIYGIGLLFAYVRYLKNKPPYRFVLTAIFWFYVLSVIKVVVFPIVIHGRDNSYQFWEFNHQYMSYIQPVIGKTIKGFMHRPNALRQIGGNIVLLFPLPFLLYTLRLRQPFRGFRLIAEGIFYSLVIECSQLLMSILIGYPSRFMDVDDVILNSVGVLFAVIIVWIFHNIPSAIRCLEGLFYTKRTPVRRRLSVEHGK